MPNIKKKNNYVQIKKVYGFPYKNHKSWNVMVESENFEIKTIRFKKSRSANRFWSKNKKRD